MPIWDMSGVAAKFSDFPGMGRNGAEMVQQR